MNFITKKNSCGSKIPLPPPPHNFSNGPSLNEANVDKICRMQFHLFLRLFWLL